MDNPNMDTIEVKSGENFQPEENRNLTIGNSQHIEMQHIQMQPVITTQPITGFVDAMPFQVTDLDQESQTIYNTLKTKHITGATVTQVMQSVGQDLVRNVRGKFISVKGNMTYDELLRGLIQSDEKIISVEPLQFKSLSVLDESESLRSAKDGGIAMLTDRRLHMLSSQYSQTSSMKPFGNPKLLPGGYKMEMSCKDATYYFYIPLELFRSVEMDGSAGNSGSVEVHGNDEGCCCCCGGKSWNPRPLKYNEFNEMQLKFGVLMPPWEQKSFLSLSIPPTVPLRFVMDFMSKFQIQAKHLL